MARLEFLLDADMPRSSAQVPRDRGYGVEDVRDIGWAAASDQQIIERALQSGKVIVTRDTGFGEVLRYPGHPGVVILRLPPTSHAREVNAALARFLDSAKEPEIRAAISIVEVDRCGAGLSGDGGQGPHQPLLRRAHPVLSWQRE